MRDIELVKQLSDTEVVLMLQSSILDDRETTAQMLVHLGEMDIRGLFRGEGYSSLFEYCVRTLHMSDAEAWLRIRAARFVRNVPMALEMVARGELHLTAISLLAPVVTDESIELLTLARHKTKSEVQELIATHFPRPDVRSEVRKLPAQREPTLENRSATNGSAQGHSDPLLAKMANMANETAQLCPDTVDLFAASQSIPDLTDPGLNIGAPMRADDNQPEHSLPALRRTTSRLRSTNVQVPLSKTRYKIQFTASKRTNDKLEVSKALMRREVPNGDLEYIIEQALDLLIADRKRKMFGFTKQRRAKSGSNVRRVQRPNRIAQHEASEIVLAVTAQGPTRRDAAEVGSSQSPTVSDTSNCDTPLWEEKASSRYLPSDLRRQVYERDQGRCRFVGPSGNRCRAREYLEFHHLIPFAQGGAPTVENIELRCSAHNAFEAERDYGRDVMKQRIQQRQTANSFVQSAQLEPGTAQPARQSADEQIRRKQPSLKVH
jgi:5-methylcytosine-specific restriction endonuclease McrA